MARLIRTHPRIERTPIIFVTADQPNEIDRLRGYEAGAVDFINLPLVPEILRSKVAVLLELHQRRSELQALNEQLAQAREQAEAQQAAVLAEREALLRATFEHPTEMMSLLDAQRDTSGRIVDWIYRSANANTLNLFGLTREALIGHRLSEVLPGRADALSAMCVRVLATREPHRYEASFGERDFLVTVFALGAESVVSWRSTSRSASAPRLHFAKAANVCCSPRQPPAWARSTGISVATASCGTSARMNCGAPIPPRRSTTRCSSRACIPTTGRACSMSSAPRLIRPAATTRFATAW